MSNMLEISRLLTETYFRKAKVSGQLTDDAIHSMQEIRARLRQIDYALSQIRAQSKAIMDKANQLRPGVTNILVFTETAEPEETPFRIGALPNMEQDELIIFVEYFYNSAHKVLDLINDGLKIFPGLKRLDCKGIRIARNHLIEHVGRKGGNRVFSHHLGPSGPRLRALSWNKSPKSSQDEGLWPNVNEFRASLNRSLESGIRHIDA